MNVYDAAHELARALKTSEEYKTFLAARQALDSDPEGQKMVKDLIAKQMELEYAQLAGKPEDKAKTEQLQKLYELLSYNPQAHAFIQAHLRFQRTMADVYKIIGDAVAEGMDIFVKQ